MKNETLEDQTSFTNLSKCSKGNPAGLAFFDHSCEHPSFTCTNQSCQCKLHHKLCIQLSIQSLNNKILANTSPFSPILQQILTVFNNLIDQLSEQRDKFMHEFKEKINYVGLTQNETEFLDGIKQGTLNNDINCKFVWDLIAGLKRQNQIIHKVNQMEKNILQMEADFKDQINKFSLNFTKLIMQVQGLSKVVFSDSKVVKKVEDESKLCAFFTQKKISDASMLYRASQNEFLISKFFEKCSNIPNTIIIVQTEFGKVIGGFTSFSWSKAQDSWQTVVAETTDKSHFLFSLTNNDKLPITKNHAYCIYKNSDNNWGPLFGGGNDLKIYDKANLNSDSYANVGHTYTNENYTYNDNASRIKYAGGNNFKIKEWEVWKVSFKL